MAKLRVELDGPSEVLQCKISLAFIQKGNAAIDESDSSIGPELDGSFEVLHRAVTVAFGAVGAAAIEIGGIVERVQFNGLLVFLYRIVVVAHIGQSRPPGIVSFAKTAIFLDYLPKEIDGFIVPPIYKRMSTPQQQPLFPEFWIDMRCQTVRQSSSSPPNFCS